MTIIIIPLIQQSIKMCFILTAFIPTTFIPTAFLPTSSGYKGRFRFTNELYSPPLYPPPLYQPAVGIKVVFVLQTNFTPTSGGPPPLYALVFNFYRLIILENYIIGNGCKVGGCKLRYFSRMNSSPTKFAHCRDWC